MKVFSNLLVTAAFLFTSTSCQDLVCFEHGLCTGTVVNASDVADPNACLQWCESEPLCNWFSFDSGYCTLSEDCGDDIVDTCFACFYGQTGCGDNSTSTGDGTYTTLMVVGGIPAAYDVEVIDLTGQKRTCSKLPNANLDVGSVGSFFNGRPTICGGSTAVKFVSSCYTFDLATRSWQIGPSMNFLRTGAAGALFTPDEWFITGGSGGNPDRITTELITTSTMQFQRYPDLPQGPNGWYYHTMVPINETTVFIAGGDSYVPNTFFFDKTTGIYTESTPLIEGRVTPHAG